MFDFVLKMLDVCRWGLIGPTRGGEGTEHPMAEEFMSDTGIMLHQVVLCCVVLYDIE